jgi:hypothetical protein
MSSVLCVVSGFRRGVNEICALLELYAASNGSFIPMFQDNFMGPIFKGKAGLLHCLTLENINTVAYCWGRLKEIYYVCECLNIFHSETVKLPESLRSYRK